MLIITIIRWIVLTCGYLLMSACGNSINVEEQINAANIHATQSLQRLSSDLSADRVRNASILKSYSTQLSQMNPELSGLADQLFLDATTQGIPYQGLARRLKDAQNQPDLFTDWQSRYLEFRKLSEASSPEVFSDALSDPINVLADLSSGQLPRINAVSQASEISANPNATQGVGKQLVGNPGYGQWQTNSSGMSFWHWYGMYSMMSNFMPSPYGYNSWSRGRGYSYYNDVGRSTYTSPKQFKQQASQDRQAKFNARKAGKRYTSPYATKRSGASGLSKKSQSMSSKNFSSRYSNSSNKSSRYSSSKNKSAYSSSSRSSYGSRSRGLSLGK